jgi:glucose/mannose-6-phosphate isomerase
MNLDDLAHFRSIDQSDMLAHIDGLPDQIESTWVQAQTLTLPDLGNVTQVVVCAVGASATASAMVAAMIAKESRVSVTLISTDSLPAWVAGIQTLVIGVSASGKVAEVNAAFQQAVERKCQVAAITGGGQLADLCRAAGGTVWQFAHNGPPRVSIGKMFALLLALFCRAGLVPDKSNDLVGALSALREQQKAIYAVSPVMRNSAKRMAGQFMDRYVLVFGAGMLGAVAEHWAAQVAANAKAWAQAESLPAAAHTLATGLQYPEALITKYMFLTLECDSLSEIEKRSATETRTLFMTSGFNTDFVRGLGPSPLAQLLTCMHYGDYVSYYLAMAYEVDPM